MYTYTYVSIYIIISTIQPTHHQVSRELNSPSLPQLLLEGTTRTVPNDLLMGYINPPIIRYNWRLIVGFTVYP